MYDALLRLADAAGFDAQTGGNLGDFVAFANQVEDLAFARGEAFGQFLEGLPEVGLVVVGGDVVVEREVGSLAQASVMGEDSAAAALDPLPLLARGVGGVEQRHAFPQVDEYGLYQFGTQKGIAIRRLPAKVADGVQVCSHEGAILLFYVIGHSG